MIQTENVATLSKSDIETKYPDLYKTLRRRVNTYFKTNKISKFGNYKMKIKSVLILSIYLVPFILILLGIFPLWMQWFLTVVMGVGLAGIGMCIMHDANHNSYFKKSKLNSLLGYSMNLIGGNKFNWKIQHNVKHHTYTNIYGKDEDLENGNVIRFSPFAEKRWFHKYQHYYSWPLYLLGTISWVTIKDFKQFFSLQDFKPAKRKFIKEGMILISTKIIYYSVMMGLPLLLLDITFWQFLIGFLTMHFVAGFILSVTFQLAHVVEETDHLNISNENQFKDSWAVHQIKTTANFARKSKLLNWYLGGLNFQIEHHLFPNVCHIHYSNISCIVKRTVEEFGFTYNEHTSLLKAIRSHYAAIKRFSK